MKKVAKFVVSALAVLGLTYFLSAYEVKVSERVAAACDPSDPSCSP